VALPPLRDRPREIAVLARAFLEAACARLSRSPAPAIGPAAMQALSRHSWPGNVRELKNAMEFVAAAVPDAELQPWHLPSGIEGAARPAEESDEPASATAAPPAEGARFRPIGEEVEELERRRMSEALAAAAGNRTRAAALIHMPLRTFVTRLKQYGLGKR
jgi:DNA-binding NtrC family response regulator